MLFDKTEKEQKFHAQMLADCKSILDKHGVISILSGSALLGAYRDGELIPWQTGIILIVDSEDIEKKQNRIKKDLIKKGFIVKKHFTTKNNFKIQIRKSKFTVEIVGYYKNGKNYERKTKKKIRTVPIEFFTPPFGEIKIHGVKYNTPKDIAGYLTHLYGDWRTPIRSPYPSTFRAKTHCRRIDK